MYYVLNFGSKTSQEKVELENFVADSVDGYAFLEFDKALPLIREEISSFPNGTFALLGLNQFVNTELDIVKKEEGLMGVFYADTANLSGFLFAHLKDSLADLQQSGFVYKKSLYADRVHIGQYKNLMVIRFTKNEESMTDAVKACESYLKSKKKSGIEKADGLMNGWVYNGISRYKNELPNIDSMQFNTSFKKSIDLYPYLNGKNITSMFSEVQYSKADTLQNEIAIQTNPEEFFGLVERMKKLQSIFEKAEKVGFNIELMKKEWDGKFIFNDFGEQSVYNEYIEYEMDEDFNTIEVVKRDEKKVKAFSCFVGMKMKKEGISLLDELVERKILKRERSHYTMLNMFDAEIKIYKIEDQGLFISNFEDITSSGRFIVGNEKNSPFAKFAQYDKKVSVQITDRIKVRYE